MACPSCRVSLPLHYRHPCSAGNHLSNSKEGEVSIWLFAQSDSLPLVGHLDYDCRLFLESLMFYWLALCRVVEDDRSILKWRRAHLNRC